MWTENSTSRPDSALSYIGINSDKIHWTLLRVLFGNRKVSMEQMSPAYLTQGLLGWEVSSNLTSVAVYFNVRITSVRVCAHTLLMCIYTHIHTYIMIQIWKLSPNFWGEFGKAPAWMPVSHSWKPLDLSDFSNYRRVTKYFQLILHYFRAKITGCGRNEWF